MSRLLQEAEEDGKELQEVTVGGRGKVSAVTDPEIVRLLLSSQEQIRSDVGNLARATAAQGAKIDGVVQQVGELQSAVARIHQHTVDCMARAGFPALREDLSEIRAVVTHHDRELSESAGYRAGKASRPKETPKHGNRFSSLAPSTDGAVSVSLSIRDPKLWGKIVFYTLVGAASAAALASTLVR